MVHHIFILAEIQATSAGLGFIPGLEGFSTGTANPGLKAPH
jgi:hypothetical protein